MADRTDEAARLMAQRFHRWLPQGTAPSPALAASFLDAHVTWAPATRTGNTYGLWKGMIVAHPDLDWSDLKRRADRGFAEIRSKRPRKPRYRNPKRLSVALAGWPESFRFAWQAHLGRKRRRASRLDEEGQSLQRSATDATAEHAFAEFVGAMHRADRAVEVTREAVQEFIHQKREHRCQPRSIGNLLAGILKVAHAAGVADLDWLLETSLDKKAERDPRQRAKLLVEPGDIVHAGMRLIAEARTKPVGSKDAKILFRDGLLLILVAHFPFRRKNLSEARIGHNVIRLDDGRYRITFSVWEMKKWNEVEYETDAPLARLIDEFCAVHRRWFLGCKEDMSFMFPSSVSDNGQLGGDAILRRFKKHSLKLDLGEFGCHDVRRDVASAIMRKNGDLLAVAAMLQHEGLGSVDTYARLGNVAVASRRLHGTVSTLRAAAVRNARAARAR